MTKTVSIEGGNIAEMVIDRFGGPSKMAAATRFNFDQVRNMRRRGNLNEEERAAVIEDASKVGIRLSAVDFIKHLVAIG